MKKFRTLFLIFIILLGFFLFFQNEILDFYSKFTLKLPEIEKEITGFLKPEVEKQISLPPPLRAEKEYPETFLTKAGVIQWTNRQREQYGLSPLRENSKLDASTQAKVEDMFLNQYFAHESPTGEGVSDLVEKTGYQFIAIGENLALGNFQNDQMLVQGWMESPGHRENILNPHYQEIGVAVVKGTFEGETTWLAVQHFGMPLSACPQPSESLQAQIEANKTKIKELEITLEALMMEIKTSRPKRGPEYNQKVAGYNNLVSQYNALVSETEVLIYQYNNQVRLFNQCATVE